MGQANETVLLVEDEDTVSLTIKTILEINGYQVRCATTAAQAIESYEREKENIDLVLTDIVLPEGVTGVDLAAKLRAINPSVKVIFTTGYSTEAVAADISLKEGENLIEKPYAAESLLQIIRKNLDEAQASG